MSSVPFSHRGGSFLVHVREGIFGPASIRVAVGWPVHELGRLCLDLLYLVEHVLIILLGVHEKSNVTFKSDVYSVVK